MKCLGEDKDSSPRRDLREPQLPWASSSMIDEPFQGKGLVEVPGCAAVCSRGVSSSFSRDIRNRGIVAPPARRRRSGGVPGVRGRYGGRPKRGRRAGVSRVAGIGSGFVSGEKRSSPRPKSRARVSAQPSLEKNLRVPVRAAMTCSSGRRARHISDSVRACAARLYGEFSSGRRGGPSVGNTAPATASGLPRNAKSTSSRIVGPRRAGLGYSLLPHLAARICQDK